MDDDQLKLLITIAGLCSATGISRSKVYELIASGDLQAIKVGRLTRLRRADVETWLAGLPKIAAKVESPNLSDRKSKTRGPK
jgi:excisionase family DNA binding protein